MERRTESCDCWWRRCCFGIIAFSFFSCLLFWLSGKRETRSLGLFDADSEREPADETLPLNCWGLAFALLVRCTVSSPFLNTAVTLARRASFGTAKLCAKQPLVSPGGWSFLLFRSNLRSPVMVNVPSSRVIFTSSFFT